MMPKHLTYMMACCLIGVLGCASTTGQTYSLRKLTMQWPWSSGESTDQSAHVVSNEESEAEESPFLPASVKSKNSVNDPSADPLAHLDPATRTLVEIELKGASPQERDQWVALLKDVEPQTIPFILSSKKLAEAQNPNSSNSPVELTGIEEASDWSTTQVRAQLPGNDPWQKKSPGIQAPMPVSQQMLSESQHKRTDVPEQVAMIGTIEDIESLSGSAIKPAGYTEAPANMPLKVSPLSDSSSLDANAIVQLIDHLQQTLAKPTLTPEQRTRHEVCLRLAYLMNRQQERALTVIDSLPADQQEYWQQMLFAMATSLDFESIPDPHDQATLSAAALRKALESLSRQAQLSIRHAAFCKKIDSFGSYDQFPLAEFRPGDVVLIYAEIENFRSEFSIENGYRTVLNSTIQIHRVGPKGGLISSEEFGATEDQCHSPRHDYYHSYMIKLPETLAKGPHLVKLIIEDQLDQKVAEYTLNFQIK